MYEPFLPQQPTPARAEVHSVEWLFEPFWPGTRLLVRHDAGRISMLHADGAVPDELSSVLGPGLSAAAAVVDGVWTTLVAGDVGAFVAVDLLELDGERLLDVPLQERRRLLDSVVVPGERVRLSPLVKHPADGWLRSWRSAGFTHYLAKHQNGRYSSGAQADDWLKLDLRGPRGGGILDHLVGSRTRTRHIGD